MQAVLPFKRLTLLRLPPLLLSHIHIHLFMCDLCVHLSYQGTGGECGLRGGYVEFCNIHPKTVEELYKICSINLSPNGVGQVRGRNWGAVSGSSREKEAFAGVGRVCWQTCAQCA